MTTLFPVVSLTQISREELNALLVKWGHKMGPLRRPIDSGACYGLVADRGISAVISHSSLVRERILGDDSLNRQTTIEVSRLCAERPGLCRVALRLWREFVFPDLGYQVAISYQDADLHSGNTYRFDGWTRIGFSASGTDTRSGRKGRRKWIWAWSNSIELKRAKGEG